MVADAPTTSARGPLSHRGVVGLLTPPANTTVEPELGALLAEGMSLHATRMPGRNEEDTSIGLRERFLGYVGALADASDSFGGMRLDALLFACTGCSYLVGVPGEQDLLARMQSSGASHVQTAAGAVRTVLERAEITSLALVSPYPEWLTRAAVDYWTSYGYVVTDVVSASTGSSIYTIRTDEVISAVRQLAQTEAESIILSGTGMGTAVAMDQLYGNTRVPLLSPNTCAAWWLTSTLAPEAMVDSPRVIRNIDHLAGRRR